MHVRGWFRRSGMCFASLLVVVVASGFGLVRLPQESAPRPAAQNPPDAVQHRKPNILLYVIDTLRADELACYGARVTKTPAFDKLASEGTLFSNCSALASATRPSMASLLTGVPGEVHGTQKGNESLLNEAKALVRVPELLKQQGYHTGGIVANPNLAIAFGFNRGFEHYEELFAPATDLKSRNEERGLIADAPQVIARINHFIDSAPKDKPWFLFVLSIDPHDPYAPPKPHDSLYDPEASGERDGSLEALSKIHTAIQKGEDWSADRIHALYRAEITYADEHFGKLIDRLQADGTLDQTCVIVTSDHGEEFKDHGKRGHGKTLYEEVTHIPLIIRYPAMFSPGQRRVEPVDLSDLSATLVLLAGGRKPAYWLGRDLRSPFAPRPIFSTQRRPPEIFRCVRYDGFKLIHNATGGKAECYYLPDDPREQKPLAGEKLAAAEKLLRPKLTEFTRATAMLRRELAVGEEAELKEEDLPPNVLSALKALGYIGGDE